MTLVTGSGRQTCGAAALIEAVLGLGVVGLVAGGVLAALTTGSLTLRMARENARASQIMLEKMETIRLYTWDQINSNGFLPTNFVEIYDPKSPDSPGIRYTGSLAIATPATGSSYDGDLRLISVSLSWQTGRLPRSRQFNTYYSRYGLQDYIY